MSWEAFLGALLPSVVTLVLALAAYLKSRAAHEASLANAAKIEHDIQLSLQNKEAIKQIHTEVNDRLTELVRSSTDSAHKSGLAAGAEQERRREKS